MASTTDDAATSVATSQRWWRQVRTPDRVPLWLAWLLVGVTLTLVYPILDSAPQTLVYEGVALAAPLAIAIGIWRYRPGARAWYLVGMGAAFMAVGELVWQIDAEDGFSGLADALFLLGYVSISAGMIGFARRHSSGFGSILDASILTAAAGSILWMAVIGPLLADSSQPLTVVLASTMYPLADIVMIGLLLRILLDRQGSNRALLLFASGVGAYLVSDLIYSVLAVQGTYTSGVVDSGWIMGYVLWGAAALHPSMATEVSRQHGEGRISNRRLAALAVVSLVPLVIASAQELRYGPVEPMPAILASAVMFVLVVARLSGVVGNQRCLIDERTRMQGALERLSGEDALTGLSNRRGFYSRLADALERTPFAVAVVYLDLDDFKVINDSMGHPAGDIVLTAVAQRLLGHVRSRDTVARLGGDEFAVLMPDCPGQEPAVALAHRLQAAIEEPIEIDGVLLQVGASFGIAVSGPQGSDAVSLMRDADVALYRAKASADRPIEVFDEDLHREAVRTMVIRNDLAWAAARDQLRLDFQPIVDLDTSRPISFEALLRWEHPDLGLLQPDEFLPLAERGGHLVAIGRWVIEEACRTAAMWQAAGHAIGVNVNLAPSQLRDVSLPAGIRRILDEVGLAPQWLVLEVTESVLDLALDVRARLDELRDWGIGLSIDDFGTGYSSLARVGELPVRELKIDRSLLVGDQRMLGAVLQFGNSLGLRVVMEGVETTRQLDLVQRLGFRVAQGFALASPMAPTAVVPWLTRAMGPAAPKPRLRLAPAT